LCLLFITSFLNASVYTIGADDFIVNVPSPTIVYSLGFTEMDGVTTPAANEGHLYLKSDGKMYLKNDAGTDYDLTAGGAGITDHTALTSTGTMTHAEIETQFTDIAIDTTTLQGLIDALETSTGTLAISITDLETSTATLEGYIIDLWTSTSTIEGYIYDLLTSTATLEAAVALNTTHRTSDGSDHGFINQDVTTTADVTHSSLTITNDIEISDDSWIGLGALKGKIIFNDAITDEVIISSANLITPIVKYTGDIHMDAYSGGGNTHIYLENTAPGKYTTVEMDYILNVSHNITCNELQSTGMNAGGADYDKFIVSNSGWLVYRTAAQIRADIDIDTTDDVTFNSVASTITYSENTDLLDGHDSTYFISESSVSATYWQTQGWEKYFSYDGTNYDVHISTPLRYEDEHRAFDDQHTLVDKEYVDSAVAKIGTRYFMLDLADAGVAAYKQTSLTASDLDISTVTASINAEADTLIEEWISPAGITWTELTAGVYDLNLFAAKTAGNRDVRLFWRFYERKADTSEVLIATSNLGDLLTTKERQRIYCTISEEYEPSVDSRLVGKVYMNTDGGSQNTTVEVYFQGDEDSHWEIPVTQDFLDDNYLSKSSATVSYIHDSIGSTQGDIIYYDSGWKVLGIGAAGKVLEVSAGGIPEWDTDDTAAGGGDDFGDHIATTTVDMAGFGIINISSLTATGDLTFEHNSGDTSIYLTETNFIGPGNIAELVFTGTVGLGIIRKGLYLRALETDMNAVVQLMNADNSERAQISFSTTTKNLTIKTTGGTIGFDNDNITTSGTGTFSHVYSTATYSDNTDALDGHDSTYFLAGSSATVTYLHTDIAAATYEPIVTEGSLADSTIVSADIKDDTIDSADYAAGSIDAEHLAADIIDETKLADNSIDSEHYNDGSIDAEHLAADVVDETKIADDGIDSEHYNDGSVDIAHLETNITPGGNYAVTISTPFALKTTIGYCISPFRAYAVTISSITAHITGGTNVVCNFEERPLTTPDTDGTEVLSGDITVTTVGWIGGSIADATIPANSAIYLDMTSVAGDVDAITIKYTLTKD